MCIYIYNVYVLFIRYIHKYNSHILYNIRFYLWIYRLKKTKYRYIIHIYIYNISIYIYIYIYTSVFFESATAPPWLRKKGPSYTLSSDLGARSQRRNKRRAEAGASGGKACATRKGLELGDSCENMLEEKNCQGKCQLEKMLIQICAFILLEGKKYMTCGSFMILYWVFFLEMERGKLFGGEKNDKLF